MLDIHSHILPGIDDGAQDMEQTDGMLDKARLAGVKTLVATPHIRSVPASNRDYDCGGSADEPGSSSQMTRSLACSKAKEVFPEVEALARSRGIRLVLGFECTFRLFANGYGEEARNLCIGDTGVLLLEFTTRELPLQWENRLCALQNQGIEVIIAHPERYEFIQRDMKIAVEMIEMGCELQISAGSLYTGVLAPEKACAKRMLGMGLVHHIASDAHSIGDYSVLSRALDKYGSLIHKTVLLQNL